MSESKVVLTLLDGVQVGSRRTDNPEPTSAALIAKHRCGLVAPLILNDMEVLLQGSS